jgi:membrane protein implicated in regulation of membrane protease activity
MARELQGKRIAILATDGVERVEVDGSAWPAGHCHGVGS